MVPLPPTWAAAVATVRNDASKYVKRLRIVGSAFLNEEMLPVRVEYRSGTDVPGVNSRFSRRVPHCETARAVAQPSRLVQSQFTHGSRPAVSRFEMQNQGPFAILPRRTR